MTERHLAARALAYTIDSIIAIVVLCGMFAALGIAVLISPDPDHLTGTAIAILVPSFIVFPIAGYGYFLLRDGLGGGSIGKRICGLRVVRTNGEPCNLVRSLIRNGVLMVLGAIDLVVPFFRADGRRIGDLAADTQVVARG